MVAELVELVQVLEMPNTEDKFWDIANVLNDKQQMDIDYDTLLDLAVYELRKHTTCSGCAKGYFWDLQN